MTKITLIGAGSAMFGRGFIADILTRPALAHATLSLMRCAQSLTHCWRRVASESRSRSGPKVR